MCRPPWRQRVWPGRRVGSRGGTHQGLLGTGRRCCGGHGRGRLREDAAAARVRFALHGPLPVPRGEDAVVLGQPGREALLLLRLREGRGHHLVRPRDGEPRLRRRRRMACRPVSRADRGRGGIAAGGGGAPPARAPLRRPRPNGHVLRAAPVGRGWGRAGSRVSRRTRARRGDRQGVPSRAVAGQGARGQGARARLHARRAEVGGAGDDARHRLLPATAHVPARRRARPRGRLSGAQAPRGRPAARQVRELARRATSSTRAPFSTGSISRRPRSPSRTSPQSSRGTPT